MSTEVRVPTTGNAGEDAVIVQWNVELGAQVAVGDVLLVLETAKATLDVEAPASGEVLRILFAAGDEVPEHGILAILGEAGEAVARIDPDLDSRDQVAGAAGQSILTPGLMNQPPASIKHSPGERVAASPRARILAERNNVDLTALTGTGPGGRIVVMDVLAAKEVIVSSLATAQAHTSSASPAGSSDYTIIPVRGARKVTARRMQESLQSTAQVTLTRYAKANTLLTYVARLRVTTERESRPKIGMNDVLLFAAARAIAKHPEANSCFEWDGIRQFHRVHLGFAVDNGQALLVPVIQDAGHLSLSELSVAAKEAIKKSWAGSLTTQETEGGTFTVSNLGSLGIHWFTPVLNSPQNCILGIGATHQLHDDGPILMPLSFTFDHRAIDGAAAAAVLADIVLAIETVDVLAAF